METRIRVIKYQHRLPLKNFTLSFDLLKMCTSLTITVLLTFVYLWVLNFATQNMAVRIPKFYTLGYTWIHIFSSPLPDLNMLHHTTYHRLSYVFPDSLPNTDHLSRMSNCSGMIFNMDDSSYSTSDHPCL